MQPRYHYERKLDLDVETMEPLCYNLDCRDKQLEEDEKNRRITLRENQKAHELYQQSPEFKQHMKAELKKKREKWKSQNRCVVCGRKLTHPVSVGMGKGPVCGKHGYSEEELDEDE
jgi:hypothetical protein